jgi:hypothetical protein
MENVFVSDKDIHVTKSPYAAYENEAKIYDGRTSDISIEHQMFKVNRGHIKELDYVIIEALSVLGFATSRMVTQYLVYLGYNDIQQLKVSNRLKFMSNINIITRFKFVTNEQEISSKFYCLQRTGKFLLLAREIRCDWVLTYNAKPLHIVKEILARNQLLLSYATKVKAFKEFNLNLSYKLAKTKNILNPLLFLKLNNTENGEHNFFFEFVRSYPESNKRFLERLNYYQEYYEYFTPTASMPKPPTLVIVGECDMQVLSMYKLILANKIMLKDMEYMFTTDLRILDEDLSGSNIKFEHKSDGNRLIAKIKVNYMDILE